MGQVKEKQLGAMYFCGVATISVLYLSQNNWLLSLLVCGSATILLYAGKPVSQSRDALLIQCLSYAVGIWNVLLMGRFARGISDLYGISSPMPGILLLLLCAYGAKKKDLLSVSAIIALAMATIMGILFLFALPNINLRSIEVRNSAGIGMISFGFFPTVALYSYKEGKKNEALPWFGMGILLTILVGLITVGLGAENFYTASMSVNLFGAMERLEPVVSAMVSAGAFCTMGCLFLVNNKIIGKEKNEKEIAPQWVEFIVATMVCIAGDKVPLRIWSLGTTVCWGVIPVIQQGIVVCKENIKKVKKIEKSA